MLSLCSPHSSFSLALQLAAQKVVLMSATVKAEDFAKNDKFWWVQHRTKADHHMATGTMQKWCCWVLHVRAS